MVRPDANADFAKDLPSCYLRTASVQYRRRLCHKSCTSVHGHPDMNTFPQLNASIVETPSRNTRKRTAQLQSDMPDSPIDRPGASKPGRIQWQWSSPARSAHGTQTRRALWNF